MIFFRCSRKMVFPGNSRPNTTFFVISGKMVFIFSRNMIFFGRKMKEDDFYQKARGNIVFSVYMRTGTSTALGPQQKKKKKIPLPEKIHLRVTSLASPKKMIFILETTAATGDVLKEKVFLEISQNSQEKTSFSIKQQA